MQRLQNPSLRKRVVREMRSPSGNWENVLLDAGSAENVLLVGFRNPALKPLTGKTLAAIAKARGRSPEDTAIDLVIEDQTRISTVYF